MRFLPYEVVLHFRFPTMELFIMIILMIMMIISAAFIECLLYAKCLECYFVYSSQQPHFTDEKTENQRN